MRILKHHIVKGLFLLLLFSLTLHEVEAQKKRKGQSEKSILREAEFYFTEGEKYFILEDYAKAMVLFQKSLELSPQNATLYFKMAQIHSKGDELSKALEDINIALNLEKDNKYFYVLAADINTQLGNFQRASEVLEILTSRIENTDQYLFELAALYLYQQRHDDAISTYDKIEDNYGLSEEIVSQKQKIYLQLNDIENALSEGKKLIEAFPENDAYILKQTEILLANDRNAEAETFLTNYLEHHESPEARLVLSDLLRENGKTDEAIRQLTLAFKSETLSVQSKIQLLSEYRSDLSADELKDISLELAKVLTEVHPEEADAHAVYGDILYASGKKAQARNEYLQALELDESNFALWQNTLQILLEEGKIDSVILVSEEALELFPNQGALYYFNGSANLQQRNYQEAAFSLERGKQLSTANLGLVSAFNSMLGDAYNGMQDYEKSDRSYEAALDYDPDNYGVLNNFSYYLALRGEKLEKAEKMSALTVKNNPENTTFLDTYAWVLFQRAKYKEAKKVMEKAIAVGGVSAVHYEHYGDILYKLGDVDSAVEHWQKAKGLNPNSELIDKKIADRKLYE